MNLCLTTSCLCLISQLQQLQSVCTVFRSKQNDSISVGRVPSNSGLAYLHTGTVGKQILCSYSTFVHVKALSLYQAKYMLIIQKKSTDTRKHFPKNNVAQSLCSGRGSNIRFRCCDRKVLTHDCSH